MKTFLITFIRVYQWTLTSVLGPRCRFYPSCSAYAAEAIEIHGVWKGTGLALKRFGSCHPFHPGGYDPVPGSDITHQNDMEPVTDLAAQKGH